MKSGQNPGGLTPKTTALTTVLDSHVDHEYVEKTIGR